MADKLASAVLELSTDSTAFDRGLDAALGKLTGLTGQLDKGAAAVVAFGQKYEKSFATIGVAAGVVVAAVGAVGAEIVSLGQRGAGVKDIRDQFASLSERAGTTADVMLGALRRGFVGAMSDTDAMAVANKTLGGGLIKTAGDMQTLAEGARLLGKRTGEDTSAAFDTLTTAMATGRTATLKQLGVFVDSKEAIGQYAKALGVASGDLNDHERATALSQAALKALRAELKQTAPDAADFGEQIDAARARITNFRDDLSVAISESPAIQAGMTAIGQAFDQAFGGDQTQRVQTLTSWVDKFAIGAMTAAQALVLGAGVIVTAWQDLKFVFDLVATGVSGLAMLVVDAFAAIVNAANKMPGVRGEFDALSHSLNDTKTWMTGFTQSFVDQTSEAWEGVKGNDAASKSLAAMGDQLGIAKAAMIAASGAHKDGAAATHGLKTETDGAGQSLKQLEASTQAAKKAAEEHARVIEQQREGLRSLGLTTEHDVIEQLMKFESLEKQATDDGVDMNLFLEAVLPKLEDLARKAKAAGLPLGDLSAEIRDVRAAIDRLAGAPPVIDPAKIHTGAAALLEVTAGLKTISPETLTAQRNAAILTSAYETLGVKSRADLQRTADAYRQAYQDILQSGTSTTQQLTEARKKWLEAEAEAAGKARKTWLDFWGGYLKDSLDALDKVARGVAATLLGISGQTAEAHQKQAADAKTTYQQVQADANTALQQAQKTAQATFTRTAKAAQDSVEQTKTDTLAKFQELKDSGTATPEEIQQAWNAAQEKIVVAQQDADDKVAAANAQMTSDIEQAQKDSDGTIQQAWQDMNDANELASHRFKDNLHDIWADMKKDFSQVLTDMLADFEKRFIGGIISALTGGSFKNAFAGFLNGSAAGIGAGAGSSAAGITATINGTAAANAGATGAGAGAGIGVGAGIGAGIAIAAPVITALIIDHFWPLYDPNEDTSGRDNGLNPYGQVDQPTPDQLNSDAWNAAHRNGYAFGTPNLDFGRFSQRGSLATLHGEEAVVPRGGGHQLAGEIAVSLSQLFGTKTPAQPGASTVQVFVDGALLLDTAETKLRSDAARRVRFRQTINT